MKIQFTETQNAENTIHGNTKRMKIQFKHKTLEKAMTNLGLLVEKSHYPKKIFNTVLTPGTWFCKLF